MEALYTALQGEIRSFKEHMRTCQQVFDIHTLYNVLLLLLPGDCGRRDIQSLEQLEELVESREWDRKDVVRITAGCKKSDIPSYISWFVSYVHYLGSLKEEFDTKIVFPLCQNLYVNDDPIPLSGSPGEGSEGQASASVALTAKQLFDLRRKWALLLKGGVIEEQFFSYQSLLDLQGFANICPFVKIIRLVPDIFHKSLASAVLAQQWVELHATKYSSQQVCTDPSSVGKGYHDTGMAVGNLEHQPGLPQYQHNPRGGWPQSSGRDAFARATIQERNKLNEVHGELMSLLWRKERCRMLEAEIQKVNQRISSLQVQGEEKEQDLEALDHQLEKGNWRTQATRRQAVLRELQVLGRKFKLEEYRKNILRGDWLLELEVRPVLLRQIHTLQECCQELTRVLQGREDAPDNLSQRATELDSSSSHSSGPLNTLSSDP